MMVMLLLMLMMMLMLMLMMLLRMRCVQQQTRLRGERGQGLLQSCWLLLLLL
jgi:hypothetical protein